jgi:hypothetical protein
LVWIPQPILRRSPGDTSYHAYGLFNGTVHWHDFRMSGPGSSVESLVEAKAQA